MKVTEQIDALEATAVDLFRYLVVTRVIACVIALPLTTVMNVMGIPYPQAPMSFASGPARTTSRSTTCSPRPSASSARRASDRSASATTTSS